MRVAVPIAALVVVLVLAVGPAQAKTTFVQDQRANSLTLQFGTDTFATHNAFGGAFVGSDARTSLANAIASGVGDGSISWLFEMRDLADLSGTSDPSFHVGVFDASAAAPGATPYDGTSDLDWWYSPDASELNGDGSAKYELSASFTAKTLDAGPGSVALPISFFGTWVMLSLSDARIEAVAGDSTAPTASTDGSPPGHVASEYVDPALTSFQSMSQGKLRGDVSARSLSNVLVPAVLTGTTCNNYYNATTNTILDVLIGGCKYAGFLSEVNATQPDTVTAAGSGTYVFAANASHQVVGCTHNGVADTLDDCLDGAAYSIYFQFTTDRVIDELQIADGKLLTVDRSSPGAGTVSSSDGIDCGTDCTEPYDAGTQVTLTASPSTGSEFTGWTGCDNPSGTTCEMTMDTDKTVTANFFAPRTLSVNKAGSGSVSSAPAGIDCGATCAAQYNDGTPVTLTATPAAGSVFAGWSGGGCFGIGMCLVTMTADTSVNATFVPLHALTVAKAGSGSGSVSSSPGGISCGATCSHSYASGTSVMLTASPAAGSRFSGWSGSSCSGTGTCTVAMDTDKSVTATFVALRTLTVTTAGSGSVSSSPAGIACGSVCSGSYDNGASVTLTATAASGFHFAGWSGDCTGTATCTLTMSANHAATATFEANPPAVECHVPKLKGKPLATAKKALGQAHCAVGKIRKASSATVKKGRVIAQKPAPRTVLPAGSKVSLTISKGKKPKR